MKKLLLTLSMAVIATAFVNAQRLAVYEEFSGENCAPCAAANPGLWTLLSGNSSKVILLKYQSPIPSAGPIYNAYKTITDARMLYYSVPFAPYGRLNGTGLGTGTAAPSSPGHVANLTQSDINGAVTTAPFTMTISHNWNATGDSVTANVSITANNAFAPSGANLKLRIAVIEHLKYATPPGTNGETDFHNVVREMVPNAGGTQLPNSWTASQNQTYTVKGKVPNSLIDKSNSETVLVAFIQDDGDKAIHQAAKSTHVPITMDAGTTGITVPSTMGCATTTTTMTSTLTLKNTGTTPLTSAKIYYRADNGAYGTTPVSWTGNLAPGATASVSIPAVTLTAGVRTIIDSVAMPNGVADMNGGNNVASARVTVVNTGGVNVPVTANFEAANFPANFFPYDPTNTGNVWVNGNGTGLAHNGSNYMPWYKIGTYTSGSVGYLIIPTPKIAGAVALDFYQAYAQKTASNNDKLEVVYSTNCGTSWTALWSKSGSAMATAAPQSAYWLPSPAQGSSDWRLRSVDLSSLPANAVLAFRATAGGGNNLFIDDLNIRSGAALAVKNIIAENSVSVYPNPAREAATLEFTLGASSKVTVSVLDATGRTVSVVSDAQMQQGAQRLSIPTSTLAAGLYNITIRTEDGLMTQRLSVVK